MVTVSDGLGLIFVVMDGDGFEVGVKVWGRRAPKPCVGLAVGVMTSDEQADNKSPVRTKIEKKRI
jgi:hypothetical protein